MIRSTKSELVQSKIKNIQFLDAGEHKLTV